MAEGMPLAILLAASWVDVLSPAEIADRMAASLDLLAADLADLPARHTSVRAVFDASWAALSERARAAFARMSVFRGGFTAEAAQEVAGADLRTLRELVRTSFLQRTEAGRFAAHSSGSGRFAAHSLRSGCFATHSSGSGRFAAHSSGSGRFAAHSLRSGCFATHSSGSGRFAVHELLRQYGAEHLAKAPADREETLDRHCATYAAFYAARARALRDGHFGPVADEVANIYAAWHWALDAARIDRVRQFVGRLGLGVDTLYKRPRAWYSGGEAAFARAVSLLRAAGEEGENAIGLGIALRCQAGHAYELGHLDRYTALIEESIAVLERTDAKTELAIAKVDAYGAVGSTAADVERRLQEGLALARESNCEHLIARASGLLAGPALHRRALDQAERYVRDALAIHRNEGHRTGLCILLGTGAAIAYARGDDTGARQCVEESIALAEEMRWQLWCAEMRAVLGAILVRLGELAEARAQCQRAHEIAQDLGDDRPLVCALCGLGDAALADGNVKEARTTYRQALMLAADDPRFLPAWRAVYSVAVLRAREGCLERAAALSVHGLDPHWAFWFWYGAGLRLVLELEHQLPPDAFAAAQERGRATSLHETVEELLAELGGERRP
jgi:tetratricopeptide (TPR) repeat protein